MTDSLTGPRGRAARPRHLGLRRPRCHRRALPRRLPTRRRPRRGGRAAHPAGPGDRARRRLRGGGAPPRRGRSRGPRRVRTHARARLAIERGRVLELHRRPGGRRAVLRRGAPPRHRGRRRRAGHRRPAHAGDRRRRDRRPRRGAGGRRAGAGRDRGVRRPAVRRWLGPILNNLGWDLHDAGRPEEALAVFERAVDVRAEADDHAAVAGRPLVRGPYPAHPGPVRRGAGADARARRRP